MGGRERPKGECVFCGTLTGELPSSVVYRDDLCTASMDIQPVNPGHVLLIPNRHAPFLADLEEDTGAHLFRIAQRLARALRHSGIRCEGVNLFLADGEAAMQEIFHLRLHVIPRAGAMDSGRDSVRRISSGHRGGNWIGLQKRSGRRSEGQASSSIGASPAAC